MLNERAMADHIKERILKEIDDIDKYDFSPETVENLLRNIHDHLFVRLMYASQQVGRANAMADKKDEIKEEAPVTDKVDADANLYVTNKVDTNANQVTDKVDAETYPETDKVDVQQSNANIISESNNETVDQISNNADDGHYTPEEEVYINELVADLKSNNGELYPTLHVASPRELELMKEASNRYKSELSVGEKSLPDEIIYDDSPVDKQIVGDDMYIDGEAVERKNSSTPTPTPTPIDELPEYFRENYEGFTTDFKENGESEEKETSTEESSVNKSEQTDEDNYAESNDEIDTKDSTEQQISQKDSFSPTDEIYINGFVELIQEHGTIPNYQSLDDLGKRCAEEAWRRYRNMQTNKEDDLTQKDSLNDESMQDKEFQFDDKDEAWINDIVDLITENATQEGKAYFSTLMPLSEREQLLVKEAWRRYHSKENNKTRNN